MSWDWDCWETTKQYDMTWKVVIIRLLQHKSYLTFFLHYSRLVHTAYAHLSLLFTDVIFRYLSEHDLLYYVGIIMMIMMMKIHYMFIDQSLHKIHFGMLTFNLPCFFEWGISGWLWFGIVKLKLVIYFTRSSTPKILSLFPDNWCNYLYSFNADKFDKNRVISCMLER